jgi:DNA-binding NarL/FixJ family response regulator
MPISLSTSQQRLIRLIAMGTTDIEIARKMALTPDQMQKAFATLCAQFNVADRVELILQIWSSDGSGKKKNKRRGILELAGENPHKK